MKIKEGFMFVPVMGKTMAVSTGALEKEFPGMIKMNEPSTDVWKWIADGKSPDQIYSLYSETYDVDLSVSKTDVDSIISMMKQAGVFVDE